MADIELQCPDCKAITSISEFAEVHFIACHACGRPIDRPPTTAQNTPHKKKLSLRKTDAGPTMDPARPAGLPPSLGYLATIKPPKRHKRVSVWRISQHITAWLIFLGLGAVMWFLRYRDILAPEHLRMMQRFAPLIVLAFHVLILLKAFQDSIFQGILCLLIPGYSFIYIFLLNDDFYARAVFAGLLVGMAEDSYRYYHAMAKGVYDAVTAWLASGG